MIYITIARKLFESEIKQVMQTGLKVTLKIVA